MTSSAVRTVHVIVTAIKSRRMEC